MRDGTGRQGDTLLTHKQMGRQASWPADKQTQAVRLAHMNNEMHQIHIKINISERVCVCVYSSLPEHTEVDIQSDTDRAIISWHQPRADTS